MNPQQTIAHVDELERLGFTDEAFSRLHHFRDGPHPENIFNGHDFYCEKTTSFRKESNNVRVCKRLGFLLEYYRPYHAGESESFPRLADAVYTLIPPLPE